jgi:hypothetical protein
MTRAEATTPGLTYWRCPECGTVLGLGTWDTSVVLYHYGPGWGNVPATLLRALERSVEAHEAEHMTVTG